MKASSAQTPLATFVERPQVTKGDAMENGERQYSLWKGLSLVTILAVICTAVMASLDVFDWFYIHSRQHEAYEYDDIVAFLTLFLAIGLLGLAVWCNRQSTLEIARRKEAEEDLNTLNSELEARVARRTSQCESELEERKKAEQRLLDHQEQLRSLSAELSLVQEQERGRIAANLHDNIGHALALVHNQLGILKASISTDQEKELVDSIKGGVKEAIRYSRSLIAEISSPVLNDLPFVSAVEVLAEEILGQKKGVAVRLNLDGEPEVPDETMRALFLRAIREILMNIMKHAEARNVTIAVRAEVGGGTVVEIADDGVGFDVAAASQIPSGGSRGLGLSTVRGHMIHLNGSCSIGSEPGGGTSIMLTLPGKKDNRRAGK